MRQLPRLPKFLQGLLGPIPVVRARQIVNEGVDCAGLWDPNTRTVTVLLGLSREKAWHVLIHERTHADLDEAGVVLPRKLEEAVCDGIALAEVARMKRVAQGRRKGEGRGGRSAGGRREVKRPSASGRSSASGKTK